MESSETLGYPHQRYIESLSTKGIIATCVGFGVDGGIMLLYMKNKFVSTPSNNAQNENENDPSTS